MAPTAAAGLRRGPTRRALARRSGGDGQPGEHRHHQGEDEPPSPPGLMGGSHGSLRPAQRRPMRPWPPQHGGGQHQPGQELEQDGQGDVRGPPQRQRRRARARRRELRRPSERRSTFHGPAVLGQFETPGRCVAGVDRARGEHAGRRMAARQAAQHRSPPHDVLRARP